MVALLPTFEQMASRARRSRALRRKLLKCLFRIRTISQYMPAWEAAIREAGTQLDLTLADQELLEEAEIDRVDILFTHFQAIWYLKEIRNPEVLREQLEAAFVELSKRAPKLDDGDD